MFCTHSDPQNLPGAGWGGEGVLPLSLKGRTKALSENRETLTISRVLLFMRAGALCALSRDGRRELLAGRSIEENIGRHPSESYLPVATHRKTVLKPEGDSV